MSKIGRNIILEINGSSHDEFMTGKLYNLPKDLKINFDYIKNELASRRPKLNEETTRVENDEFEILSGVSNNLTNGDTLEVKVYNKHFNSNDYNAFKNVPRPGHGDYMDYLKHGGDVVKPGGGSYSGRLTVLIVLLGSILKYNLEEQGINIESQIDDYDNYMKRLTINRENHDSTGGMILTTVKNVPRCLGDHWFDSAESCLSQAIMSIHSVKGILFGAGLDFVNQPGSAINDKLELVDGQIKYSSNHNGGISAGITTGEDIIFKSIVRPTPSIPLKQRTLDIKTKEMANLELKGRFDFTIVRRIMPVINNLTAFVIFDLLQENK